MRKFTTLDWRVPRSPPWVAFSLGQGEYSANSFEEASKMFLSTPDRIERRRSPQGLLKADKGKGVHRVPSLEELDQYAAGSSGRGRGRGGGGFKKDNEYQKSKELDPMECAWLIQQGFVSSIRYKRRMKTNKKSTVSMESLNITNTAVNNSKNKSNSKVGHLSSLQHLDLATGWQSSRHVLVEEVITNVLAKAQKSADLSRLQHLGLPPRYLPTIAEAIQAEHLAEFKHLDLANTGSLGQKSLELRRLVETRLPTFLRSDILPYSYSAVEM